MKELEKKGMDNWKKSLFWILFSYCFLLFLTVLIRSVISGITYDEAYTYMYFGTIDLFNVDTLRRLYGKAQCIANNHWLNSVLINILQKTINVYYNEFLIRLPSLFFFILYMVGIMYGLNQKYYSLSAFIFLISSYYLLEFYGLARGYGMANTCVFFACLSLCKWRKTNYQVTRHLIWMMIYMSIGVFANTIVLLLYPAFGLICLIRILEQKQFKPFLKKCGVIFFLFAAYSLIMIKYHMNVSSEGKPLYTGGNQSFFDCVVKGFVKMIVNWEYAALIGAMAVVIIIIVCGVLLRKDLLKTDFPMMLVLFLATNLLLQLIFHKGYIATRVLIPFYSFMVLCFYELYSAAWSKIEKTIESTSISTTFIKKTRSVISTTICGLLVVLCLLQINVHSTRDWQGDYRYKTVVEGELLTGEHYIRGDYWNAAEVFYQEKMEMLKNDYLQSFTDVK